MEMLEMTQGVNSRAMIIISTFLWPLLHVPNIEELSTQFVKTKKRGRVSRVSDFCSGRN